MGPICLVHLLLISSGRWQEAGWKYRTGVLTVPQRDSGVADGHLNRWFTMLAPTHAFEFHFLTKFLRYPHIKDCGGRNSRLHLLHNASLMDPPLWTLVSLEALFTKLSRKMWLRNLECLSNSGITEVSHFSPFFSLTSLITMHCEQMD